jgi:hypothetical protein
MAECSKGIQAALLHMRPPGQAARYLPAAGAEAVLLLLQAHPLFVVVLAKQAGLVEGRNPFLQAQRKADGSPCQRREAASFQKQNAYIDNGVQWCIYGDVKVEVRAKIWQMWQGLGGRTE